MRLSHRSGRTVHLSCGTNLYPARDLTDVVAQLDGYADVRARLGVDTLGLSLWLPPTVAAALAVDARGRARLRAELDARGLETVTLSGLPYAGPGAAAADRWRPDWSTVERLEYTLDCARILVDLLPDDAVRGSVTTIGVGRRADWDATRERAGTRVLSRLSGGLAQIAWQTGRAVRVGLQPGPGAVLDSVEQIAAALARVDRDRVGICLDLAALACTWQEPESFLTRLAAAGVSVIRASLTAAVTVPDPRGAGPADPAGPDPVGPGDVLDPYAGYEATTAGAGYVGDVGDALLTTPGPWRVRYPVPLSASVPAPLGTTAPISDAALRRLMSGAVPGCEHLDVHTVAGDRPTGTAGVDPAAATAAMAHAAEVLRTVGLVPAGACAAR